MLERANWGCFPTIRGDVLQGWGVLRMPSALGYSRVARYPPICSRSSEMACLLVRKAHLTFTPYLNRGNRHTTPPAAVPLASHSDLPYLSVWNKGFRGVKLILVRLYFTM